MKKTALILLLVSFFLLVPQPALADSLNSFDVVATLPENQLDQAVTYFDLLMKPDQEQTLTLSVTNRLETTLPLELSLNKALTNGSGVVEYSGTLEDTATSPLPNIEELMTLSDNALVLQPNETKEIQLKIHMPSDKFLGVLAGGLYIKQVASEQQQEGNITNLFSREIAILLRTDKTIVKPQLAILSATAIQENARNVIEAVIDNQSATYLSDVTVTTSITQGKQKILNTTKEDMKIAPNSQFHYRIPLSGEPFEAGTYTVNLEVTSGKDQWQGSPTFTIQSKEAAALNQRDVSIQAMTSPIPWSTIILVSVLLMFALLLGYLMHHNRQLKQKLATTPSKRKVSRKHH